MVEHNMNKVKMLEFPQHGDDHGHLVIVEGDKDVPFTIMRAFYIYGSDADVIRGQHANRESEFVLINVAGKSKVKVKALPKRPVASFGMDSFLESWLLELFFSWFRSSKWLMLRVCC